MSSVNRDECQRRFCLSILYGLYGGIVGEISLERIITNANLQPKSFFCWRVRQVDDFIIIIMAMIIFPPYDFAV